MQIQLQDEARNIWVWWFGALILEILRYIICWLGKCLKVNLALGDCTCLNPVFPRDPWILENSQVFFFFKGMQYYLNLFRYKSISPVKVLKFCSTSDFYCWFTLCVTVTFLWVIRYQQLCWWCWGLTMHFLYCQKTLFLHFSLKIAAMFLRRHWVN